MSKPATSTLSGLPRGAQVTVHRSEGDSLSGDCERHPPAATVRVLPYLNKASRQQQHSHSAAHHGTEDQMQLLKDMSLAEKSQPTIALTCSSSGVDLSWIEAAKAHLKEPKWIANHQAPLEKKLEQGPQV
ncbi:hypothetical protein MVEG_01107 [Podila verticillata NRRL 6337]|nr:hypothetical protein MVEG_01107 [Podila verticillata NRRL 6337]